MINKPHIFCGAIIFSKPTKDNKHAPNFELVTIWKASGVVNPAFTDITYWEICEDHEFNDHKLSGFCAINYGPVLHGYNTFVFTPVLNNDIKSYI